MTGIVWCYYGIFIQSMQEDWTIRVAAVHVRQIMSCHMFCQYHTVVLEL